MGTGGSPGICRASMWASTWASISFVYRAVSSKLISLMGEAKVTLRRVPMAKIVVKAFIVMGIWENKV